MIFLDLGSLAVIEPVLKSLPISESKREECILTMEICP